MIDYVASWSMLTAAASLGGLWAAGYNPRYGWWLGFPIQAVWAARGIVTGEVGDVLLSVAFTILYVRNLRRWKPVPATPEPTPEPAMCCGGTR